MVDLLNLYRITTPVIQMDQEQSLYLLVIYPVVVVLEVPQQYLISHQISLHLDSLEPSQLLPVQMEKLQDQIIQEIHLQTDLGILH